VDGEGRLSNAEFRPASLALLAPSPPTGLGREPELVFAIFCYHVSVAFNAGESERV
jgi:hypothetical protein